VAEFQWWLLIVGIVAGGGLVAVVLMDGARREADIEDAERQAEATWISQWLSSDGRPVSRDDVEAVLRAHRDYLTLPPPDRLVAAEADPPAAGGNRAGASATGSRSAGADADRPAHEPGHDGRGGPDHDLADA